MQARSKFLALASITNWTLSANELIAWPYYVPGTSPRGLRGTLKTMKEERSACSGQPSFCTRDLPHT